MPIAVSNRAERVKLLDLTLSDFFWLVVINLLLFESTIQNSTGFTYIDEIASILLIGNGALMLRRDVKKTIDLFASRMLVCAGFGIYRISRQEGALSRVRRRDKDSACCTSSIWCSEPVRADW